MCIGKNVRLKPIDHQPEDPFADALVEQAAGDLGEPVVRAGQNREQRAAAQHVVEVRHGVVRVVRLPVDRHGGEVTPLSPPIVNWTMNASAYSIGTVNRMRPPHSVASHEKTLMPVGTAMVMLDRPKNASATSPRPTVNMWCAQTVTDRNAMAMPEATIDPVAEDRLAGEDRDDLRDDAEGRQRHDVHLGVAEVPEQVLPQDRVAAVAHVEEVRAEIAIDQQHGLRRGERRNRRQDQPGGDQRHPGEDGQLEPAHARRAQA